MSSNTAYLIKNASIIDGAGNQPFAGSVLIESDKIKAVGKAADSLAKTLSHAEHIDADGCTVMPGLIDGHCHISFDNPSSNDELFFHRREGLAAIVAGINVQKILRAGVTGVFDADCIFNVSMDVRDAVEAGVIEGPRLTVGGNVLITCTGGAAGRLLPDEGRRGYAVVVQTQDDMLTEVRRQIKAGVDWIKLHISGLKVRGQDLGELRAWTYDEIKLVCDVAHDMGVRVVAHCRSASSTLEAARAGVDVILHATFMDEEALEAVVESGAAICPALAFQANLAEYGHLVGASPALQRIFKDEISSSTLMLRCAYDAGVPIFCGSEGGFSITPYGDWHHRELEVFVEHMGLTPIQAIQCATQNAASVFEMSGQLGCIKPDYYADVLIIDGDPAKDISILGDKPKIRSVFKNGELIDRSKPLPENWQIPGWRVSPFSEQRITYDLAKGNDGK